MPAGKLWVAALAVTLAGCGEEDEKKSSGLAVPAAKDITTGSFAGGASVEQSEATDEAADLDVVKNYARKSSASFALGDIFFKDCDAAVAETDTITASGGTFEWDYRGSAGECFKKSILKTEDADNRIDESVFTYEANLKRSCADANFDALNGKSMQAIIGDPSVLLGDGDAKGLSAGCAADGAQGYQMRVSVGARIRGVAKGRPIALDMTMLTAITAADDQPCKLTLAGGTVKVDGCLVLKRKTMVTELGGGSPAPVEEEPAPTSDAPKLPKTFAAAVHALTGDSFALTADAKSVDVVVRADLTGATAPLAARYWTTGVVPVTIGDWTGAVTLDGTATPKWELKRGTETRTGRIGASTSSSTPKPPTKPTPSPTPIPKPLPDEEDDPEAPTVAPLALPAGAQALYVGGHEAGTIDISVTKNDVPFVLVVSAYNGVEFKITRAADAKLVAVILSGYHPSKLRGDFTGVKVLASAYEKPTDWGDAKPEPGTFPYFYAYKDDSEPRYLPAIVNGTFGCSDKPYGGEGSGWKKAQDTVKAITGLAITGAQGEYTAKAYTVDNQAHTLTLKAEREGGYCYKNPDGTITRGP